MRNQQKATNVTSSLTFEQRFFALPSDLQVQIVASLPIPDILNLRMVSRNWHNLILLNETPISRAFLEHNPVPQLRNMSLSTPRSLKDNFALHLRTVASPFCGIEFIGSDD